MNKEKREGEGAKRPGGLLPSTERKAKSYDELQRERDLAMADSADQFEQEFSKDTEEPLTDAVRAARAELAKSASADRRAFAGAFEEQAS